MDDAPHAERGQREHTQRIVVVRADQVVDLRHRFETVAEERRPQERRALVAPGEPVELQDERVKDHAEGEREHAEVNLHVAHAERGDRNRDQRAEGSRRDQDDLERADLRVGREERPGVGAEPDEERVAERDEPRVSEQEVEPEQDDRVGHERQHQEDVVGRGDERRGGDGHRDQGDDQKALHVSAPPKRPRGRRTSTTITMK